uniref:Uncharacterized protein n=1 Tax=Chromera velia CCMP2878 TaxID=1169474 RepID=A0A0G4HWJ8_9ALVE|eukprot:Cvel_9055.t1-p1 / transcript=Cvel_9055.t1 / gene=Cvel_9055 / organism=Chromera_velia_CCMP2878 / gene_product=hypothetical protein / transcript_product=hypothetical protein / location=Cvel_scaffold513:52375-57218(-) / protein_length=799 / sequence_SO=supercontig / SO=protein_coding / is_pseudo=false
MHAGSAWPQSISRIVVGAHHALIVSGGRVMAFGDAGFLGFEDGKGREVPTEIPNLSGVKDACAGLRQSVLVMENGRMLGWSGLSYVAFRTPVEILPENGAGWEGKVVGVSCGQSFSAAWTDTGSLYVWHADLLRPLDIPLPCVNSASLRPPDGKSIASRKIPAHVFNEQKVLHAAFGKNSQLLVFTEDRDHVRLCRDGTNSPRVFAVPPSFQIPSERPSVAFIGKPLDRRWPIYFLIILQDTSEDAQSLRHAFVGSLPHPVPSDRVSSQLSLRALSVGDGKTNVEEVSGGEAFGLVRLQNGDLFRVEPEGAEEENSSRSPFRVEMQPELRGKVLQLSRSFHVSRMGAVVLTVDGPMRAPESAWTDDAKQSNVGVFGPLKPPLLAPGRWCDVPHNISLIREPKVAFGFPFRAAVGVPGSALRPPYSYGLDGLTVMEAGDRVRFSCTANVNDEGVLYPPQKEKDYGSVCTQRGRKKKGTTEDRETEDSDDMDSPLEAVFVPPLESIECRGCEVPPSWQKSHATNESISSLPLRILKYGKAINPTTSTGFDETWKDWPEGGAAVPVNWAISLGCRGLLSLEEDLPEVRCGLRETAEGWAAQFETDLSAITCTGCHVNSTWTNPEPEAPSLPFSVELKRFDPTDSNFTKYDKDTQVVGVGDMMRLSCPRGRIWASSEEDLQRAQEGMQCQKRVSRRRLGNVQTFLSFGVEDERGFSCVGCTVPNEWVTHSEGSRFFVEIREVIRSGGGEKTVFEKSKGVGINDTLVLTCPGGGVITRKRTTCVEGEEGGLQFDVDVNEVKCGE